MDTNDLRIAGTTFVPMGNEAMQLLAPYCEAPRTDGKPGVQLFEREDAEKIVREFYARRRRSGGVRRSVPVYNGHPDCGLVDVLAADDRDPEIYARVESLEARADGLYGSVNKAPEFERLKAEKGRLEISPFWLCRNEGGKLRPRILISLGLVSKGNLPDAAQMNEFKISLTENTEKTMTEEQLKRVAELLGGDATEYADAEKLVAAIEKKLADLQSEKDRADERAGEEKALAREREEELAEEEAERKRRFDAAVEEAVAKRLAEEKESQANAALLDAAVADGRIPAAKRDSWASLINADPAAAKAALSALPKSAALGAKSQAGIAAANDAKLRSVAELNISEASREFHSLMNSAYDSARERGESLDYDQARASVLATERGAALYAAMTRKV